MKVGTLIYYDKSSLKHELPIILVLMVVILAQVAKKLILMYTILGLIYPIFFYAKSG